MAGDPYTDPVTGVLRNKLGLATATRLKAAEREITHAALILLRESPPYATYDLSHLCEIHRRIFGDIYDWAGLPRDHFVSRVTYYLGEVNAVHPFREGNGRTQRAFFEQLAADAGYTLAWQRLNADRNISASDAIMRGDPEPMHIMLDELIDDH
jgi:cell filamentation protein